MRKSRVQVPFPALEKYSKQAAFGFSEVACFFVICDFGDSLGTIATILMFTFPMIYYFDIGINIGGSSRNCVGEFAAIVFLFRLLFFRVIQGYRLSCPLLLCQLLR